MRYPIFPALCLAGLLPFAGAQSAADPQAAGAAGSQPALTPEQEALYTKAGQAFNQEHWGEAIAGFQKLHAELPDDATVTKFEAEAEVNAGSSASAVALLDPLLAANGNDTQALGILAHAYAQAHQPAERDHILERLQALHDSGASSMQQMILERDPLPNGGSIRFFYFFQPWSSFHVYTMARIYDSAGSQTERITLESDDTDQPGFAQRHPDEAAKGMRFFSMDGYIDHPKAQGDGTQTHFTYAFFDGRPTYDVFRDTVLAIAAGTKKPLAKTDGIALPPPTQ